MNNVLTAALLLLCLLPLAQLSAQETLINKVFNQKSKSEVKVTLLNGGLPASGYAAVQIEVTNNTKIPRSFTLNFTSSDNGYSSDANEVSSTFSFKSPAKKAIRQTFSVPVVTIFQNNYYSQSRLSVNVTGTGMSLFSGTNETEITENWPAIIISKDLELNNGSPLDSAVSSISTSRSGAANTFGYKFNAKNMSEDWRTYLGYDLLFITSDEWLTLSPGARIAILRWYRQGGHLRLYTSSNASLKSLGLPESKTTDAWGSINIRPLPSTGIIKNPTALVKEIANAIPKNNGPYRMSHARSDYRSAWNPQKILGEKTFNVIFFIIVLIAFAILVGPVNLFVFAKAGERHKLFVTTPLISAGASLLLLLLIFFQDGFGGKGERQLLIEIRPAAGENTAHVIQEQFCRTGVLLSTGFSVNEPSLISPVLVDESRWARATVTNNGGNSRYNIKPTDKDITLAGDWFQSRSEQGHLLETIRPSRERLELSGTPEAPSLASTFSYAIDLIYYKDRNGELWKGTDLTNQKKQKLKPTTAKEFNQWVKAQANTYTSRQKTRITNAAQRNGHFIALSTTSPGIDTLPSIKWNTKTILTGPVTR